MTNLRILDAFLSEKNSEALVKDAIRIVKPYFFANTLGPRLEQEARKVFDGFKAENTANDVLMYYMMNQQHPEFRHAHATQRLQSFNEDRDRTAYLEALFPDQSRRYALKRHIALMGSTSQPDSPAITNAAELEKVTREQYQTMAKLRDRDEEMEAKWQAEHDR